MKTSPSKADQLKHLLSGEPQRPTQGAHKANNKRWSKPTKAGRQADVYTDRASRSISKQSAPAPRTNHSKSRKTPFSSPSTFRWQVSLFFAEYTHSDLRRKSIEQSLQRCLPFTWLHEFIDHGSIFTPLKTINNKNDDEYRRARSVVRFERLCRLDMPLLLAACDNPHAMVALRRLVAEFFGRRTLHGCRYQTAKALELFSGSTAKRTLLKPLLEQTRGMSGPSADKDEGVERSIRRKIALLRSIFSHFHIVLANEELATAIFSIPSPLLTKSLPATAQDSMQAWIEADQVRDFCAQTARACSLWLKQTFRMFYAKASSWLNGLKRWSSKTFAA